MTQFSTINSVNNFESSENNLKKWAEPDLNRRPLARKANVLTRLDDQPSFSDLLLDSLSFGSILITLS